MTIRKTSASVAAMLTAMILTAQGAWAFCNLGSWQFEAPGTYTVTVAPGSTNYAIDTSSSCSQTFGGLK